jgi:NADPH:quinone reductase-like Zn-dependent oxidoreductase
MMKAVVLRSYGTPDDLAVSEIDKPVPRDDEVLVRVRATSVQPYDWHHLRGEPYIARLMPGSLGLRGPKISILGADMAGQVEAAGGDVTGFSPGDEVFAQVNQGGFAEYVCVREGELAPKPKNLTFEQAAAVPMAANTALLGLRDQGRVQPGQKVLINGASGGVGTFAVQLAKAFGAEVTASAAPGTWTWSARSARTRSSTTPRRTSRGTAGVTISCWTSPEAAQERPAGGC